ncbi:MAG: RdgB/HAM1 family non-canonical purine NTP pyrophosphatase [Bacteroidales bacterium]|nr:RdgB/HAM1 family non-canonical purine NTP pyrophosphatase [Bacteroidales bacterium]
MDIIFASHNQHKVSEVQAILGDSFNLLSLSDINYHEEIIEDADSLEGNARIKAQTIWKSSGKTCFADDTGLEVEALDGAPGVHSARYAGVAHDDQANLQKLLLALQEKSNRKARFRTVICLIIGGKEQFFEGIVNGHISEKPSGKKGFGYDPVFIPDEYNISFAEMDESEKNLISHRGSAVKKLTNDLFLRFLKGNK